MGQHSATRRERRRRRPGVLILVPLALLASSAVVYQASNAAFTAQTSNPNNTWTANTVVLSNDKSGSALFTVTNAKPGDTGVKCLQVKYSGTEAADIKFYLTNYTNTAGAGGTGLGSFLDLTVEQGTWSGGYPGDGTCGGFQTASTLVNAGLMDTVATAGVSGHTDFATGVTAWSPTANSGRTAGNTTEIKYYQITWSFPNAGNVNNAQGGSAAVSFTWEAQGT